MPDVRRHRRMAPMNKTEAIRIIDEALDGIPALRQGRPRTPDHIEFVQSTGLELGRIFGPESPITRNFNRIKYSSIEPTVTNYVDHDRDLARARRKAFLSGLDVAEGVLRSARAQLERHGVDRLLRASRVRAEGARVFISHGGETAALAKLERFLKALGLNPVVVIREPSEGMSLDDLVDKRLTESDCVVILATGDDAVDGRKQPRLNVVHEIGLAQEKHPQHVVYLKEVGCEFPSNVASKVWENFTQDNMEKAFEKVSKELRAFGLL